MSKLKEAFKLVSNERAVLVGLALSLIATVGNYTVDGRTDWRAITPVAVGLVIRQFVYGPKAVNDLNDKVTEYDEILKEIVANVNKQEAERAQRELPFPEGNAA